ncbi:MAG TPA: hypothetical protein VMF31_12300 [Solirubrobacterales bacterium]|nr:hypothetical protein [Solirubrobacterales bacterium]
MATEPADTTSASLKVLLVADEEFRGQEFMDELRGHINGRSAEVQVFVIAPALAGSGLAHELASFDEPIRQANERLERVLKELKGVGIEAVGEVGDGDVVVAIGDGLREFDADEIIVVAHADKAEAYGEKDLWKNIKDEFHPPVVELIVGGPSGDGRAPGVIEVNRDSGHVETEQERIERTRNVPPFTKRDIAGILVGFLGTIALGLIAVGAGIADSGELSGGAAVIVLLAIGSFLINAAHIVGLLFFESVRYTGFWEKVIARGALLYTIPAVVASLIIWATI